MGEVLELLQPRHKGERDTFFNQRLYRILQESSALADTELDPES